MAASYSLRKVAHALVLIKAEQQSLSSLGGALAEVEGVSEAFSVTGEWDFVAIVRVPEHDQLAGVVTERMAGLPGIKDTYTMVAYEVFSQHDLEAMFSIGG
jgi:DNA-binding Lrp family transcriptional regulator